MSVEPVLTWRPTQFEGSPPENDDGMLFDDGHAVGRVRKESGGADRGWWAWSMFATGRGGIVYPPEFHNRSSGKVTTKDLAKAAAERCYRELVEAAPGNRAALLAHKAAVRARFEAFTPARLTKEKPRPA